MRAVANWVFRVAALALVACGGGDVGLLEQSLGQSEQGLASTEFEGHPCGNFQETAYIEWDWVNGDDVRIKAIGILQSNAAQTRYAKGLDYEVSIRVAAEGGYELWSSRHQTSSTYAVCYDVRSNACWGSGNRRALGNFYADRSARPYVHIVAGKDGDGRKSCSFNIWPLAPG